MSYLAPPGIVDYAETSALGKAKTDNYRLAVMAMLGGVFLSMGGLLAVTVAGGAITLGQENPGLQKFVFGAVFPLGFIAVVITGADLFTSNVATTMVPLWRRTLSALAVGRIWLVSYFGNFAGSILAAVLFAVATGLLHEGTPATDYLHGVVEGKLSHSTLEIFLLGMAANFLVCTAAWQAYAAQDVVSKMFGIWFPVMAFVTLGMEHSVANMFFFPAALMTGVDATFAEFVIADLIPTTLGNIAGGALFIGLAYAWIYTKNEDRKTT